VPLSATAAASAVHSLSRMVAEVRHDPLRDEQINNDKRRASPNNRKTTSEMDCTNARQQHELSAEMMQLLTEALDDFDEPCSRVGLVHGFIMQDNTTDKERFTMQHGVCGRSAVEMDAQTSERGSAQFGTSFSTSSGASEARCQRGQMPIEPDVPTSKEPLSPMPLSPLQLSSTEPNITSEPSPCRHNVCVPMETMTKAFSAGPFSPRAVSPARNTGAAIYTQFRLTRPASVIRASEQTQHAIQPVTPLTISNGKSSRGGQC